MLLIHSRFQPGVKRSTKGALNRFNGFRIFVGAETVKTVAVFFAELTTRLKPGVNEKRLLWLYVRKQLSSFNRI